MRAGGQRHDPADLPLGKRRGTHCRGGWVWTHGQIPAGAGYFLLLPNVQIYCGVQRTSSWMRYWASFPEVKRPECELTIHLHAMKRWRMGGALANGVNNICFPAPKIISDVNPRSPDRDPECCLLSEEVTAVRKNPQSSVFRIFEGFLRRGVCGGPVYAMEYIRPARR